MKKYYITISEKNLFDSLGKGFIHPLKNVDKYKDKTGSFTYDNIILVSDIPQYININKEYKYILLTIELDSNIVSNTGNFLFIHEMFYLTKIKEITISDKKNHPLLLNFNFRNFNISRFSINIQEYKNIIVDIPEIPLYKENKYNLQIKLIASLYMIIKYDCYKYSEMSDITKIILNIIFDEEIVVTDIYLDHHKSLLKEIINYLLDLKDNSKEKIKSIDDNKSLLLIIEVMKFIINDFDYIKDGRTSLNIDEYLTNILKQIVPIIDINSELKEDILNKYLLGNKEIINKRTLLSNENTWILGIIEILKDVLLEDSINKIDNLITHFKLDNLTRLIVLIAESFFNGFSSKEYEFKDDDYLLNLLLIKTNELFESGSYRKMLRPYPGYIYSKSGFIISEDIEYYKKEYYVLISKLTNTFTQKEYESIYVNGLNYLYHNVSLVNNEYIGKITRQDTLTKLSLKKIEKNKFYLAQNETEYLTVLKSIKLLEEKYSNELSEVNDKDYNDKLLRYYSLYFIETITKKTNSFSKSILNKNVLKKSKFKLYKEYEKYLLNNINNIKTINIFLKGELDNVDK